MANPLRYINDLLEKHNDEASEGFVDKPASRLLRGEGTERKYYIMKVDLVGSTQLLLRRRKETYLKLAHTFLSTIDKITQDLNADPIQTEYAGDSVLAYFPEGSASAEDVITAACYARAAVMGIGQLKGIIGQLNPRCKIVLHFDSLIVSNIGPRANAQVTAIGFPLHVVAKLEKEISSDTGRTTEKFYQQVNRENKKFLAPVYIERQVPIEPSPLSTGYSHPAALGIGRPNRTLADLLGEQPLNIPLQTQPQYQIEKQLIGYDLKWSMLFQALNLVSPPRFQT